VLYDPEDRSEVELQATQYVLLRERDLHAVAAPTGPVTVARGTGRSGRPPPAAPPAATPGTPRCLWAGRCRWT
ncbi:MAG TPA: hypothetical protein VHN80_17020, partial [Kineosporiaceae bacterium]|nr:hypothetical protein [Kineosporiaceae bacterium]